MHKSLDADATTAQRALRLYQKLLLDGRRHFQADLADYLGCSPQTVMRLIAEIEGMVGPSLVTGLEKHKRWYQIRRYPATGWDLILRNFAIWQSAVIWQRHTCQMR